MDAKDLSAPVLSETVQALKSLTERLPQAFEQTADVLARLAANDKITLDQGDPKSEAAMRAAELRAVAADSEQLGKSLSHPASALFRACCLFADAGFYAVTDDGIRGERQHDGHCLDPFQ
ncbi:hypothetical protein [Streptomyces sp. NPDC096934]|uniref:hypothetical protein n=1 Tax=Streptomyces sp. NPDC096934 TaxID=3155551 RepID=UPI00331F2E79